MIKYNNTNNASTALTAWISPSSTTLIVENGDILPTAPFLLTLEHFDNEKVTVREIVKCIAKAWNILTIQRGAWTCVQDDSATPKAQNNTPHSFSVWDCASIYWTSEQVQDIQNEIEKKLNIDDFQAWTYVYGATSTWTDAYSITIPWTLTSYSVGQVFRFMADVDNEGNATLNINGLWAIPIMKNHDKQLDNWDIEAWQIVEVAYDWENFQMNSQVATIVEMSNLDHLEDLWRVWTTYNLTTPLFRQNSANFSEATSWEGIWRTNYSYEVHIQKIWSGVESNQIKIWLRKVWDPTRDIIVEIRRWNTVIEWNQSFWYWDEDEVVASSRIPYTDITTTKQEFTVSFTESFWSTPWELLDVVLYQEWHVVNSSNYYIFSIKSPNSTYMTKAFSYVMVNNDWTWKVASSAKVYCESSGFFDTLLTQVKNTWAYWMPRSVQGIWNKIWITTFWRWIDWVRIDHNSESTINYIGNWRTPTSETKFFFPLTESMPLLDVTCQNSNLTNSGGVAFENNYAIFSSANDVLTSDINNIGSWDKTVSVWFKKENTTPSTTTAPILVKKAGTYYWIYICVKDWKLYIRTWANWHSYWTVSDNVRNHVVYVFNTWQSATHNIYLNWSLVWTETTNWYQDTTYPITIWNWITWTWYEFIWKISQAVMLDTARNATAVTNYYNQTKDLFN